MICGGDTDVYFQYVSGDDGNARRLFEEILAAAGGEREVWLILELTEENGWRMGIFPGEGQELPHDVKNALDHRAGEIRAEDGRIFYAEPLGGAGTVYVFGGGHVAQELVPLLAHLGFRCAVMDDREEFSSPERFPAAAETITGDLGEIGRRGENHGERLRLRHDPGTSVRLPGAAAGIKMPPPVHRRHGKPPQDPGDCGAAAGGRILPGGDRELPYAHRDAHRGADPGG